MEVEHEYTLPAGPLGTFADVVLVQRMIERKLEQSLENLKMLSEAPIGAV